MQLESARELKGELRRQLAGWRRAHPVPYSESGAVAVGVCVLGPDEFGVAVRYSQDSEVAAVAAARGRELAGDRCDIRGIGPIRVQQWTPDALRGRMRPLRPGLSIAHVDVGAGSVGAFVTARADTRVRILSNNHVLADADRGRAGDVVLQPGPGDGGGTDDRVGVVDRIVPLRAGTANVVDAATAVLDDGVDVDVAHPAGRLIGSAGVVDDVVVEKVGRTTGLTTGRVSAIELDDVVVEYPVGPLDFDGQIEVTGSSAAAFSAGGDSGSVVYRPDTLEAIGLLFAGSDRGGPGGRGLTYCNPFPHVLAHLGVALVGT